MQRSPFVVSPKNQGEKGAGPSFMHSGARGPSYDSDQLAQSFCKNMTPQAGEEGYVSMFTAGLQSPMAWH